MSSKRSRQGCDECRRRRRKCDEQKPKCGLCANFSRDCHYTIKVVWGGRRFDKSSFGQLVSASSAEKLDLRDGGFVYGTNPVADASREPLLVSLLPHSLPNGVQLPSRYRRLLEYFTEDVLASLSCHPEIHDDFRKGLVPATLHSPQLLSACLALSAAGLSSRGLNEVDGIEINRIFEHLQTSGLPLLRNALEAGEMNEVLLATCLIWCLAEIFAYRQGLTSWMIHLQGIKAMLDSRQAHHNFINGPWAMQSAMKHLHQLYLSLQTLPFIPLSTSLGEGAELGIASTMHDVSLASTIDGFLGYSGELLYVLQEVDRLAEQCGPETSTKYHEIDILLGKVKGMIHRDTKIPPKVALSSKLSPEYGREFILCHRTFQQATLIHIYRRLYHKPSVSPLIQESVEAIQAMLGSMSQGKPCHAWVAMAMPIFTIGCEAFTSEQKKFTLEMVTKLDSCIGSLHVKTISQALRDLWAVREAHGDMEGRLCAHEMLGTLNYNIVLF